MEKLIKVLIDEDMTVFIKERQTQDNIRRTLHIVENVQGNEDGTILVRRDAEKAFDSMNGSFLYTARNDLDLMRNL